MTNQTTSEVSPQPQPQPQDRMESSIPFAGFYESVHSQKLDDALAQLTQDDSGEQYEIDGEVLAEDMWRHLQWSVAQRNYAKAYVESFNAWVKDVSKVREVHKGKLVTMTPSLDLAMEYSEMTSPHYYNFATDRIFVTIPRAAVHEMFRRTSMQLLDEHIHKKFTSYDGFHSYYPNSLAVWLGAEDDGYHLNGHTSSLDEWDGNQVGTLLEAFLSQYTTRNDYHEFEWEAVNDDNGTLTDIVYEALDDDGKAILQRIDDHRDKLAHIARNQGRLFE